MCPLSSTQGAHRGAINTATVGQSMYSLLSNQGTHRGAINTATVGQSMYSLSSNQCTHCAAIVMLSNTAFMQQCSNQNNQYQIISTSYFACSNQESVAHFQRCYCVVCCQGYNSAKCYKDGAKTFTGCVRLRCVLLEGHG